MEHDTNMEMGIDLLAMGHDKPACPVNVARNRSIGFCGLELNDANVDTEKGMALPAVGHNAHIFIISTAFKLYRIFYIIFATRWWLWSFHTTSVA